MDRLEQRLTTAAAQVDELTRDDAAMVAQAKTIAALVEVGRDVASQVTARARDMQALSDTMGRAMQEKDALVAALAEVQARQEATVARVDTTDGQLARAEALMTRLEERGEQAALSETRVAAIESRCLDIVRLGEEMERRVQSIVERDDQVRAVKAEVDEIHAVCARSKADMAHVADRRGELTSLRTTADALLSQVDTMNQRLTSLKTQMTLIDAVQDKAETVAALLDDVRAAYDLIVERQDVVEQVAEKISGLEVLVQEARAVTARAQRQPSERLERKIQNLNVRETRANETPEEAVA
jgi:hypothetical protein